MLKGQGIKPEQIVMLLSQVEVLTANGKTQAQACKEIGAGEQNYYRWRKMDGGMENRSSQAASIMMGLFLSAALLSKILVLDIGN